jgi:hypothetical protein
MGRVLTIGGATPTRSLGDGAALATSAGEKVVEENERMEEWACVYGPG